MYAGIVAQYLYTGIFQKNYIKDIENIRNRVARNYIDVYGVDWVYGIKDEFIATIYELKTDASRIQINLIAKELIRNKELTGRKVREVLRKG